MANAWGELAFGEGNFGEQNNITVPVTGIGGNPIAWNSGAFGSASFGGQSNSIPLSLSEETASGEINSGWGRLTWGENPWGIYGTTLTSGQQLNLTTGNLDAVGEINEGWGRLTWGENAWGAAGDVVLQGLSLSVSTEGNQDAFGQLEWSAYNTRWGGVGSVDIAISQEINVSGQQLNISQGEEEAVGSTVAYLDNTNLGLTAAEGTVDPAPDVMLTGIGLTANVGTVDSYNEQGWGRDDWGTEVWGAQGIWSFVDVTGEGLSVTSGIQETWGQDEWGATTTEWGGNSVTDVDILSIAAVTGNQLTATEGTVDPSPDATVVGIGLSASVAVGSVVEADANVTITGIGLEIAQGQAELDANTIASITGQQLNTSLNSAVAGASAEVFPTGNGLTVTVDSINVQSWQIVDTGTNVNWNIIDTAA